MPARIDIKGQRYGRLEVVGKAPSKNRHTYWVCQCDCGAELTVRTDAITRGPTKSCGCYHQDAVTQHGMYLSSEYITWQSMLTRCENPNFKFYCHYGGRGISVCERWHNFELFYQDMGPKPKGLTLERIDNDGDYKPDNCRWATYKEQGRNRRYNRTYTYQGQTRCLSGWAEQVGINVGTLTQRMNRGWTIKDALETPVDLGNRWKQQRAQQ